MKKYCNKALIVTILTLAWPTMMEQLLQTAVQYIDTAMVGALGTSATAAVGATTTVAWMVGSTVSALGVGFLSFIARSCGAGNKTAATHASAQAVLMTLVYGSFLTVLLTAVSRWVPVWMQVEKAVQADAAKYFLILYLPMLPRTAIIIFGTVLRAAGDTKTPMKVGLTVNLLNVLGNFLLIFPTRTVSLLGWEFTLYGADLGVMGAALASAIAFCVGGVYITVVLWRHPLVSPKGLSLKPDKQVLMPCLKVALPNMLQRFGTTFGYVAFASMINNLGETATAAHTIANTVESAFYIPGYGMQTAAATLAGNAYGAGEKARLRELARMFMVIETLLMLISGAALLFSAAPLVALFSDNGEVVSLGSLVLRMVALSEPFFGVAIILEGMMLGTGNTRLPFMYNLMGMWGVRILGTAICTTFFSGGLAAAWGCMIAHNILLCLLFVTAYLRNQWIR